MGTTEAPNRRMWAIAAVLIVTYAGIQAVAFAVLPERDADGEVTRGGRVDVATLQIGDCFDWVTDRSSGSIRQVDLTPCNQPHEANYVSDVMFPAASTAAWPGVDVIEAYGQIECSVGQGYLVTIMPTEDTWASGDRRIACVQT